MDRLEELKGKYASVLSAVHAQGVVLAHCHVQDDKLFLQGAAPNEAAKNAVWTAIKAASPSQSDISCDLTIDSSLPAPSHASGGQSAGGGGGKKYTVAPGDTLSKISAQFYGSPNHYMKIAQANGIDNPNLIQVGQELDIPAVG